jgi:bacterioferritin (cytochrome b1)
LIVECLATLPEDDPRQRLLFKIRHLLLQDATGQEQRDAEFRKLTSVVEKLTAPANRVGTLLAVPADGVARIAVGGAEYYANVDPRVPADNLKIGTQLLVNEAYAVIRILGYDANGPVLKVSETLADGRLRIEQEPGRQGVILQRGSDLTDVALKPGDCVRVDPTHRIAIERLEDRRERAHLLDEVPTVTWEQMRAWSNRIAQWLGAEVGHAQRFARRIKELYGVVPGSAEFAAEQSSLQPPDDQVDIVHVIKGVIEAERGAIEHYSRIIAETDGIDPVTQDMVIEIVGDEQGHLREFEGFLREYEAEGLA